MEGVLVVHRLDVDVVVGLVVHRGHLRETCEVGTGEMVPSSGEMFAMCARWAAVGGPFGAPPGRRRGIERRWRPSTRATPFAVVVARALMQKVFIESQVVGSVEPARTIASTSSSASVPTRPPSSTAKGTKRLSGLWSTLYGNI